MRAAFISVYFLGIQRNNPPAVFGLHDDIKLFLAVIEGDGIKTDVLNSEFVLRIVYKEVEAAVDVGNGGFYDATLLINLADGGACQRASTITHRSEKSVVNLNFFFLFRLFGKETIRQL